MVKPPQNDNQQNATDQMVTDYLTNSKTGKSTFTFFPLIKTIIIIVIMIAIDQNNLFIKNKLSCDVPWLIKIFHITVSC